MLYLASQSPRRRQLLEQIGVAHQTLNIDIDESWDGVEPAREHVLRLAGEKARQGFAQLTQPASGSPEKKFAVLAADTAVVLRGSILGKATHADEAAALLRQLSGLTHEVMTGVALMDANAALTQAVSISTVRFRTLTAKEIQTYCASGEPLGKAGGYAIQGRAAMFIEHLSGSYSGVMGLPLFETVALLRAARQLPE